MPLTPSMQKRGGGAKQVRIRQVGRFISIDLLIDVCQAMAQIQLIRWRKQ